MIQFGTFEEDGETKFDLLLTLGKTEYYLDECIIGKIAINAFDIKIKQMTVTLVRSEIFFNSIIFFAYKVYLIVII